MSVKIEFFGDDWAAIAAQMHAALGAGVVFEATAVAADQTPQQPKATRSPNKPKDQAPKEESKGENALAETDAKGAEPDETEQQGLNYETDIKPLVLEIAGRFGRDKVMEVLAKYGVTNAGRVPVEDQSALMDDIRLVLEG